MKISRIHLKTLDNTRDLGGFRTSDGKTIASHRLIRSGELSKASVEDINVLVHDYGVRSIVDFRMDAECAQAPPRSIPGAAYIHLPILDNSFFGIARDEDSVKAWMRLFEEKDADPVAVFREMYRKLLFSDYVKPLYRSFFNVLLQNEEGAVLWHCSAGKDRAGMAALLVMMSLGVPREDIVRDYMMTERFTKKSLRKLRFLIRFFVWDKRKKLCYRTLLGVDESYVRQLFDIIDRDYSDERGYLTSFIGLTDAEIAKLRQLYLVS